ncbi:hypothetical protein ACP4OV_030326 [Aristida adscensionis]
MPSSFALAAASFPSSALARLVRFGSLPLAVLPGHAAAGLVGRRDGTAYGGVLLGTAYGSVVTPPRVIKAESGRTGSSGDEYDEYDFEGLKNMERIYSGFGESVPPFDLSLKDIKLKDIAERSIGLLADALINIPRSYTRPLISESFFRLYFSITGIAHKARAGCGSWATALELAYQLDLLRRLISSACTTPLPLTVDAHALPVVEIQTVDDSEAAMMGLVENLFVSVESDVKAIVSASTSA